MNLKGIMVRAEKNVFKGHVLHDSIYSLKMMKL